MILARGLGRSFPGRAVPALADLSFAIGAGEIVALAGRNGSGKTTLLDVLGTLLLPTAGEATVAGHDVAAAPERVRRRTGYAMTGPRGLYARLSGRRNLEFFAALHPGIPDPRASVEELVTLMEMAPFIDEHVRRCSDGMLQKLVIARALLGRPEVLLLDEPMRALDPVARRRLTGVLEGLVGGGAVSTVLYATHDLAGAAGRRTLVLSRGRLVYDGRPAGGEIDSLLEAEDDA